MVQQLGADTFVDNSEANLQSAVDTSIIQDQLQQLKINRMARNYQRLTGDPLSYDAFLAAGGDAKKAQNFLAYGQLVRRNTVKPSQISDQDVGDFAKSYYENQAGRQLTAEEDERLRNNLSNKKTRQGFKDYIAQQQTANNLQSLNSSVTDESAQKLADKVNPKALQFLNQQTGKQVASIQESGRTSRSRLNTLLPRLERILKSNKLPSGTKFYFSGFTDKQRRAILASPELDELLAAQKEFARDARSTFGGRVTNFELDQYLQAFPNIEQTPEGRLATLAAVKQNAELAQRESQVTNKIIRNYRANHPENAFGYPPNFNEQLEASLENDPRTKSIYDKFNATTAYLRGLREVGGSRTNRQEYNDVLQTYYSTKGSEDNFRANDVDRITDAFRFLKSNPDSIQNNRYLTLQDGSVYVFGSRGGKLTLTRGKRGT